MYSIHIKKALLQVNQGLFSHITLILYIDIEDFVMRLFIDVWVTSYNDGPDKE